MSIHILNSIYHSKNNNFLKRRNAMGVIGTAIRLNQVPEQYKKLELKGRGATSIA